MGGSMSSLPSFSDITGGIGNIVNPPPALTEEQIKEVSTARDAFYAQLKDHQEKITYARDKGIGESPDSVTEALQIITNENTWLLNNPNANFLQIKSHSDNFNTQLRQISERDISRAQLTNFCKYMKFLLSSKGPSPNGPNPYGSNSGLSNALLLITTEQKWLSSNQSQQGLVYTNQLDKLEQGIAKELSVSKNEIQKFATGIASQSQTQLDKSIEESTSSQNLLDKQQFSSTRLATNASQVALSVFLSLILIVIILFGGCLAANMAIGRTIYYRIFYFLFACLPWITPFVYVYAALLQLRGRGVTIYSMLPITTTPATTRLGKVMLLPFLYVQDANIDDKTKEFMDSLEQMASVVLSRPPPSPGNGGSKCES